MKKLFLIWLLSLWSLSLTWCFEILDWPGMEREIPEWWERITVATDMCNEQWWKIEEWNEWWDTQDICFFPDESFCYLEDLAAEICHKWEFYYFEDYDELAACDVEWEDIVCGKDGNTYYNRCYLDFAWVEEETELAEVVDGECVFG